MESSEWVLVSLYVDKKRAWLSKTMSSTAFSFSFSNILSTVLPHLLAFFVTLCDSFLLLITLVLATHSFCQSLVIFAFLILLVVMHFGD